ncbi:MAG TPA: lysylphosphatidylglycerol synthase domain-containing protein [Solirubrobacteraceae bacterium]|nr:lysylphosphatidylglycerol synthase domain-containing protein [Solirubrobacteraceae bacterium]
MRIALLSPYSWTYPGGVTRHIEALARELTDVGHDARILAPFDPDDATSRRLHRGARPQRHPTPERFVSLGRTVGIPANGAVSNMALTPSSIRALRGELRDGGYDVAHIHEPVVPLLGWDALLSAGELPLVGTFHTYSENALTNGVAAVPLGGRRRMNRLHARIAVSEAAAWTARRFYGGRYRIVPNGVHVPSEQRLALAAEDAAANAAPTARDRAGDFAGAREPLRIVFIGQAVARKGLPVLLRAFEALREQVPATLTLVGASEAEIAHMLLDGSGVRALGKVSDERKLAELARADVLCAPSLHGESFGMILTEAFAAATPVLASDIPGYRDVVRDGVDGQLVPAGDPLALAEALRGLAFDIRRRERMARAARERAERFAWPHVAAEVLDTYEQAIAIAHPARRRNQGTLARAALRHGFAPADLQPRVPAQRLPSLAPAPAPLVGRERRARLLRRGGLAVTTLAGAALAAIALERVGVTRVLASLLASKPGLILAGLALMCGAMFTRAISWHAILAAAPTWRRAKRRDAMQGTFIGVLMSATLPARLGEPSRALIVARRIGRARETLPIVLGTIVSQAVLNLLALAILAGVTLSSVSVFDRRDRALLLVALAPLVALVLIRLVPTLAPAGRDSRAHGVAMLRSGVRLAFARLRDGLRLFARPRQATIATLAQLLAWTLQWLSCWLLLVALGLDAHAGAAAAGVLFAVNVTAVMPATPANVGVFQAACVVVLAGAYHASTPDAIAYGIVLQAVELATAALMGLPALLNEGLSWREVRLRTAHAAPVTLGPLPHGAAALSRADG